MEYTEIEQEKLKNFFSICNEMINGKFILSDIKITRLLKSIADSQVLYALFNKSLVNFNFIQEFQSAKTSNRVNGGYFKMPRDEKKIIGLVFCLLMEIDQKKIRLQDFITENFFSNEGYNVSYSNFSLVMLMPFKNSVLNLLKIKEDGKKLLLPGEEVKKNQISIEQILEEEETVVNTENNLHYANLRKALNELGNSVMHSTKIRQDNRDELLIIINAINDLIDRQDLKTILALSIVFEYALGKDKNIKYFYESFKNSLIKLLN